MFGSMRVCAIAGAILLAAALGEAQAPQGAPAGSPLAVIGVLVEEGEHDSLWDPIIASLPEGPGDSRHVEDLDLDMSDLRPLPRNYFRYRGSLTTPPCSEGVEWIVMAEKRQISPEQMAAMVSRLHDNNRPVQPIGDRKLGLVNR